MGGGGPEAGDREPGGALARPSPTLIPRALSFPPPFELQVAHSGESLPAALARGLWIEALYPNFTTRLRLGGWGELTKGNGSRAEPGTGDMGFAGIRGWGAFLPS